MGDGWRVELQPLLHLGSPLACCCASVGQTWVNEGNMAKERMGVLKAR